MALTWKDAVGTLLTAGVIAITIARLRGWELPFLSGWRMSVVAIFVLGIATCIAVGSGTVPENNAWTTGAGAFGILAVVLLLLGLIFDSQVIFTILALDIVALWALTTLHHSIAP